MSVISREDLLTRSMDQLAEDFKHLNWNYPEVSSPSGPEKILYWPGDPKEDIMICVLKDQDFFEELHRHDFFFFNYAYKNDYEAETEHTDYIIRIREGECYIGPPFAGYGLRQTKEDPAVVIGVLVQKNMFYRDFLPIVSTDPVIFRFFLDPRSNAFSEDFLTKQFAAFAKNHEVLMYTATKDGEILAQNFIIFYGPEASYHYGVSSDLGTKYSAAPLLHIKAMAEARKRGCIRYNLWGIVGLEEKSHRFYGVSEFKRSFGCEELKYTPAHDLILKPTKYQITKIVESARKKIRHV